MTNMKTRMTNAYQELLKDPEIRQHLILDEDEFQETETEEEIEGGEFDEGYDFCF